jgi:hypothetical protein
MALWVNDSASVGIPSWRYYFNASFPNTQIFEGLGVYHSSENSLIFGTYPFANSTTQQVALSRFMQGAWARFAKNPLGGPGWNAVSTRVSGLALAGASNQAHGGYYRGSDGSTLVGDWNVAVLGNAGNILSSGVTVMPQAQIDAKCAVFAPVYKTIAGGGE